MTYQVEQKINHVALGVSRLLGILQKPHIKALLAARLRQWQKIETAAHEVAFYNNVENGFGVILDNIGALVVCGRGIWTDDEDYRVALRVKIRINRSFGEDKDFEDVGSIALPELTWHVDDFPPAFVLIYAEEPMPSAVIAEIMRDNFREVKALGVGAGFEFTLVPASDQMLNGWNVATASDGHGMAWTGDDYGGKMSHLVIL